MRVVVTGGTGFIGQRLCRALTNAGLQAVSASRRGNQSLDVLDSRGWDDCLAGVDVVVHLAARAHVTHETAVDPIRDFRNVNVAGTLTVANAAVRAGVRRFVFVSSIGVLGNTSGARVMTEHDPPAPAEPYAKSKWEAEQELRKLQAEVSLDVVIVRPTLVYGGGAKGNFDRLLRLVASGLPLPLGSIRNLRSFIGVENLCELLIACTTSPAAAGGLFLAADGEDVSTPQLLIILAESMHRRSRVFPCPVILLRMAAQAAGRVEELEKLTASLRVDASLARSTLGWTPRVGFREGIAEMVHRFDHKGGR